MMMMMACWWLPPVFSLRVGKKWSDSWQLPVPKSGAQWSPIPHVDAGGRLNLMYAESEVGEGAGFSNRALFGFWGQHD